MLIRKRFCESSSLKHLLFRSASRAFHAQLLLVHLAHVSKAGPAACRCRCRPVCGLHRQLPAPQLLQQKLPQSLQRQIRAFRSTPASSCDLPGPPFLTLQLSQKCQLKCNSRNEFRFPWSSQPWERRSFLYTGRFMHMAAAPRSFVCQGLKLPTSPVSISSLPSA